MEKRIKKIYSVALTGLTAFIILTLVLTSSISQNVMPSPDEDVNDMGRLNFILIAITSFFAIGLIYMFYSHFFWKIEEKNNEWKVPIKDEDKKAGFKVSNVNIISK